MKKISILSLVLLLFLCGFINSTNKLIRSYGSISPTGPFRPITSLNSSENVYFTIYNTETGQVWNEDSGTFVDTDDASVTTTNYGNIAISCTDKRATAEDGWLPVIPTAVSTQDSGFQADLKFYSNATPANTDAILFGRHCYIKASNIGGVIKSRIWTIDDL